MEGKLPKPFNYAEVSFFLIQYLLNFYKSLTIFQISDRVCSDSSCLFSNVSVNEWEFGTLCAAILLMSILTLRFFSGPLNLELILKGLTDECYKSFPGQPLSPQKPLKGQSCSFRNSKAYTYPWHLSGVEQWRDFPSDECNEK